MVGDPSEAELLAANRANWDDRAPIHAASQDYRLDRFGDPAVLSGVVEAELETLGDVRGLRVVHLQCHIGTDTLSLARLGAKVTGVDQSAASLAEARRLFGAVGAEGRFVEATVYDAPEAIGETFDLVYTGTGALNWLPSIDRWAEVVDRLLVPGGRLHVREAHPILWALDNVDVDAAEANERLTLRFPYFETIEPVAFDEDTTYTDGDGRLVNTRTYEWNHGTGEILTAVLDRGLVIEVYREHREIEWAGLPHLVDAGGGRFAFPPHQRDLVPCMYTLVARKPA